MVYKKRKSVLPPDEQGLILSFMLISVLVALFVAAQLSGIKSGPVQQGQGTVLLSLYIWAWGFMFLASYYFSHKTFFLRWLAWFCMHASYPASRKMAFFYFGLSSLIGVVGLLAGLGIIK